MSQAIFDFDIFEKENSRTLFHNGYDYILGCDEAGRGPGAGPLFTACVCFKDNKNLPDILDGLNDSKQLTEKKREELFPIIKENSFYSIQKIEIEQIDKINILNASLFGMSLCAYEVQKQLEAKNVLVLVDGNKQIKNFKLDQKTIIKGDSKSASIAAASILAKVSRDKFMEELDKKYPMYNFKKNKGYLTKEHIEAIKKYGICEAHRKSFLKNILN